MRLSTFALACCVVLTPVATLEAQQTQAESTTAANPLSEPDRDFIQAASMSSSTEIDAAKLAQQNTKDKDVKSFAHHMLMDHTKMTVQLKAASPHDVTVPKDNSDTGLLDALRPLKGKQFDDAYIAKIGVHGHEEAIAAFKKEISEGQNADLKNLAKKGLPVIEEHYRMAEELSKKKGISS